MNCTGSCSWKIYVKGGIVTWETQQTDYPRTRPDLPNHEPRGCSRGASYSWYLYSGARVKYPMVRGRLLRLWRAARAKASPVAAWASIVEDAEKRKSYVSIRGHGGFVRATWDEVNEIIAAANAYTVKTYGPDRVIGFSPIPAMSMVSYAAGSRYLSLIGGVCMSFYDWYCDLPPASPQTWGEQTDVPESADWYNAGFLILVGLQRSADAHARCPFLHRGALSRRKERGRQPGLRRGDQIRRHLAEPEAGDRRGPRHGDGPRDSARVPSRSARSLLRRLRPPLYRHADARAARRAERPARSRTPAARKRAPGSLGETNNPEWKTVAIDEASDAFVAPLGSVGYRWGESGKWNLEEKDGGGHATRLRLTLAGEGTGVAAVDFPYFGGRAVAPFAATAHGEILTRNVPVRSLATIDGKTISVATVYDLLMANYGLDRGFGGGNVARSYDEDTPFTPAWAERVTGVKREAIVTVAREFAANAEQTNGRSMIIIGAGMNHWYHMDMNYRGVINLLAFCGAVGQSGGGWAHYVGQEKLRPQTGWTPLAFALDWARPPRQQNSTSFFYAHTDQWRYETLTAAEILSPTAPEGDWNQSLIDYNVRAERMGWLPSAPQLRQNPLSVAARAKAAGLQAKDYVAKALKSGELELSCHDPDDPANWPRNMFVWRSNLLGSSGKGHEYFLKHLIGTQHGVLRDDLGAEGAVHNREVVWRNEAPRGKLDLLVTLDFRMSTTCVYSDVVLPTATWYEKNDLNTSDMHPFIHPLSAAVDPAWESRTDWDIYKGIAKAFSAVAPEVLGVEQDVVLTPIQHDTPAEIAQALDVKDWKRGEVEPIPGKTMPAVTVIERDYPNVHARFTALGPLMTSIGNGGKGIAWKTEHEVAALAALNGARADGPCMGMPKIETDIDAAEVILMLAPETNGEVAVKAWKALSKATGRGHAHLAESKEDEKIRFRDIVAQPRKIISSPTWSGLESEKVCYSAGYTNVHELIPWRTLTGRQQLYQDHLWMRAFGEGFVTWKPPVDLKAIGALSRRKPNGHKEIALNFITPHQKWGIHSTYTDNLLMLTLNRGGPVVWISEADARSAGIVDNDWVEAFNANGALTARAVVSQRVMPGMMLMYHAQEKIINTPGSEITGNRGGIHNSVTRAVLKPTHMIGGYAQQSFGFNYYGTVGSNRDEFVLVRKMANVDWLEQPSTAGAPKEAAE